MKGQAGVEFLTLFALVAFVLLLVSAFFYADFQTRARTSQAAIAADKLASAVDAVAAQGPGSSKTVIVYFPSGVINATASGREVLIVVASVQGMPNEISRYTLANISRVNLPKVENRYLFTVIFNNNGTVSISD